MAFKRSREANEIEREGMTALDGWMEISEGKPEQDCPLLLMGM